MESHKDAFAKAAVVATYGDDTPKKVPGLFDLHRMTMILLSEHAQQEAHMLVVGAGGGMELNALGQAQKAWTFVGVDPSAAMLDLARDNTRQISERIGFVEGTIDAAPIGPFDGATCLLTLHFLDRQVRLDTLKEIHRRLRSNARLVIAHHIAGLGDPIHWLTRSAIFADRINHSWDKAAASGESMAKGLSLQSAAEEEALLREAGFVDVELFYAAFSFRGWVATAKHQ